ncbi:glycerol-1-phosphatase [Frankia sp. AiPs1]|uniref:HAD-IIA family hydrolase n=1 Tax=Frankia sp. AiPa1 TaxID=573492 RepID=UPI00202B54E6|nr:HAD-IIA family hydrolase [Frankia sp. AiPa1]MCL9759620.1 HAD-IIA family hydrolase [Frankia sp. AiPa1]
MTPEDAAKPEDAPLRGTDRPLVELFDVALMDLDGVVNRGAAAVPHAADTIAEAARRGLRTVYVTNNALRPPREVADRLTGFGVPARAEDVVTSAQAAAHVLAGRLPAGSRVLVLGGRGLREAVADEGLTPVTGADDDPAAVVQGFDPELTYARIAEAAYAIQAGAWWVASNADRTVPTERGIAPGNGSIAALLRAATEQEPLVTGKPEAAMHRESMRRSGARTPVIVGDRLDTDIEAGTRSGTPTLLVFTGVATPAELLAAPPEHRPTFIAPDLRGLLRPASEAVLVSAGAGAGAGDGARGGPGQPGTGTGDGTGPSTGPFVATCGAWTAQVDAGTLSWSPARSPATGSPPAEGSSLSAADGPSGNGSTPEPGRDPGDDLDALRAACAAGWAAADAGVRVHTVVDDRPPGCARLDPPARER